MIKNLNHSSIKVTCISMRSSYAYNVNVQLKLVQNSKQRHYSNTYKLFPIVLNHCFVVCTSTRIFKVAKTQLETINISLVLNQYIL